MHCELNCFNCPISKIQTISIFLITMPTTLRMSFYHYLNNPIVQYKKSNNLIGDKTAPEKGKVGRCRRIILGGILINYISIFHVAYFSSYKFIIPVSATRKVFPWPCIKTYNALTI
jgi:hypothetical protein